MAAVDLDASTSLKRRRVFDFSDFGRNAGGFIDNCRFCNKQIIRKGQSRPRICLECEKKKATPINDRCKDCHDAIVRSNVRKARICPKCKKMRERTKHETSYGNIGFPPRLCQSNTNSTRIFAMSNWIYNMSQFQLNGHSTISELLSLDQGLVDKEPTHSNLAKINTEKFNAPEELVEFLLKRQLLNDCEVELISHENSKPILIPQVNPYAMHDVSLEQMKRENEVLASNMQQKLSNHIKRDPIRIKEEPPDDPNVTRSSSISQYQHSLVEQMRELMQPMLPSPGPGEPTGDLRDSSGECLGDSSMDRSGDDFNEENNVRSLESVFRDLRSLIPNCENVLEPSTQSSDHSDRLNIDKNILFCPPPPILAAPFLASLHVPKLLSESQLRCPIKQGDTNDFEKVPSEDKFKSSLVAEDAALLYHATLSNIVTQ